MKIIKKINTFAIALPFTIFLTAIIFGEGAVMLALLSTMLTGFLQFSIGVKMLVENPKDQSLQIYMTGVAFFFGLWFINNLIGYNNTLTFTLFPMPIILAIYLSIIVYKK
ncbi:hypothetical protein [Flavobacterium sp. KACC 22763]|uniref:hypothetical protein n=1 Tax=Flavobacterium sp. KACC 22763 TaxID=3025668 RepID=UPI002365EFAA|nr:hypothetical protein [Flavobacterium sp. KACC 22763]WDF62985.1 hypothetical protein PQ463_15300 [Flavobacterium sp. KACC 22763]